MSTLSAKRLPTSERTPRPQACPDAACEALLDLPYLCTSCGTLLRDPPGLNHFARFGFQPSMEIDAEELERQFLELSRRLHPDRMLREPRAVQSRALILSSALNEAYTHLKDERLRAEHLLATHGGPSATKDRSTPAAFLMEQMELREEVEELQARDDREALRAVRGRALQEQRACLDAVRADFADEAFPSEALLKRIRETLNVLKYWVSLAQELSAS